MKCPTDQSTLLITERSGIEIDYCPECRGVWLDRGELDKMIDRVTPSGVVETEPRRDEGDDYRHKNYDSREKQPYKKKKRESFLADLFEF